jgi:pimeloyl-ACP methyl ester carboxylesterase
MSTATRTWTERFAQLSHGQTRYWEAGTGYPTILVHGAGWTSGPESWVQSMAPLAEAGLRVLAIDCLNWGTGDVLDQEFSFAYLVDHLREFMDALGIDKANFVGHSMGGWLVTLLAYESPERVNKLVNADGGGAATRPLQNMVEFKVPEADQIRQQLAPRAKAAGLDVDELAAAPLAKRELPGHGEAFAKVMRHMTNPLTRQRYNTLRRLPRIKAPTLVIWGREDPVNALEMGEATARGIPGARLIVYDGVGHGPPQEVPDRFNRDVVEFLTRG